MKGFTWRNWPSGSSPKAEDSGFGPGERTGVDERNRGRRLPCGPAFPPL